ncbi:MAG TPA: transcriptional regulator [Firmicutes bacterium]|nr:transcriptional regulator [Bacillota bacterium]
MNNKTIKELRKNQGFTAKELAIKLKVDSKVIKMIDNKKLKDVPEPLKTKISPVLRGDILNKIPWL